MHKAALIKRMFGYWFLPRVAAAASAPKEPMIAARALTAIILFENIANRLGCEVAVVLLSSDSI